MVGKCTRGSIPAIGVLLVAVSLTSPFVTTIIPCNALSAESETGSGSAAMRTRNETETMLGVDKEKLRLIVYRAVTERYPEWRSVYDPQSDRDPIKSVELHEGTLIIEWRSRWVHTDKRPYAVRITVDESTGTVKQYELYR